MNGGPGVEKVPRGSLQVGHPHSHPCEGSGGPASGQALLYQRREGGRQGEAPTIFPLVAKRRRLSQNRALPGKSLLRELPLLSVLCVWQEGPGLCFLLRLLWSRSRAVAWQWTLGQAAARRVEWERGPAAPCPEWSRILMSPGTLSCPCLTSSAVSFLWWSLPWVQSCVCLQTHLSHSIPICFLSPKNSWNSQVHGECYVMVCRGDITDF